MTEWFEEWFGEEYLHLYPHRDDADAERIVALIVKTLAVAPGSRVLDVACGAGRHARAFRDRGLRPIGLDLSPHLLMRARAVANVPLIRADMRYLPVRTASMDLTVNLVTSFGYFETDADHQRALGQMMATLRPGGWFVLDFLNATHVRATLVAEETSTLGGEQVDVARWLGDDGRFVHKTITVPDGRQFVERVRLFESEELAAMIAGAGGRVRHCFGGYDGRPCASDAPRIVLMARAA
jgi:SAM-dependent methyltransferase